jgi:hypothetical protein
VCLCVCVCGCARRQPGGSAFIQMYDHADLEDPDLEKPALSSLNGQFCSSLAAELAYTSMLGAIVVLVPWVVPLHEQVFFEQDALLSYPILTPLITSSSSSSCGDDILAVLMIF